MPNPPEGKSQSRVIALEGYESKTIKWEQKQEKESVRAKQKEAQGFLESTAVAVHTAQETERRHRIVRAFS